MSTETFFTLLVCTILLVFFPLRFYVYNNNNCSVIVTPRRKPTCSVVIVVLSPGHHFYRHWAVTQKKLTKLLWYVLGQDKHGNASTVEFLSRHKWLRGNNDQLSGIRGQRIYDVITRVSGVCSHAFCDCILHSRQVVRHENILTL